MEFVSRRNVHSKWKYPECSLVATSRLYRNIHFNLIHDRHVTLPACHFHAGSKRCSRSGCYKSFPDEPDALSGCNGYYLVNSIIGWLWLQCLSVVFEYCSQHQRRNGNTRGHEQLLHTFDCFHRNPALLLHCQSVRTRMFSDQQSGHRDRECRTDFYQPTCPEYGL